MSRTRRILDSSTVGYVHQAVVILVGLWLTPFLLHKVGQREYGLWLVAGHSVLQTHAASGTRL